MQKNKKKLAALMLAASMSVFSAVPAFAAETQTFTDVPESNWAYSYIEQAAAHGWVNGYGDGRFGPEDPVTYAELSQMLTQAFFPDELASVEVQEGDPWYAAACIAAENLELFVGVDVRTQHLNDDLVTQPATRYEMAQILSNAIRAIGANLTPNLTTIANATADWSAIPYRYQGAVAVTKAVGLITGTDAVGTFSGDSQMSRAQAATIMVRLNELVQNGFPDLGDPVDVIEIAPTQPETPAETTETVPPSPEATETTETIQITVDGTTQEQTIPVLTEEESLFLQELLESANSNS